MGLHLQIFANCWLKFYVKWLYILLSNSKTFRRNSVTSSSYIKWHFCTVTMWIAAPVNLWVVRCQNGGHKYPHYGLEDSRKQLYVVNLSAFISLWLSFSSANKSKAIYSRGDTMHYNVLLHRVQCALPTKKKFVSSACFLSVYKSNFSLEFFSFFLFLLSTRFICKPSVPSLSR
jgi:hypothetical protein